VGTGFCNCFPIETTGEGRIVVNGPCHLTGGLNFIVDEPIVLTLRGGRIVNVEGGSDATRFAQWLESYHDDHMNVLAHLGFGYDRRCGPPPKSISTGDFVSWEAMYGCVIVAFGANLGRSGGQNAAPGHCDLMLLGASFAIGGTQVLRDGEFPLEEFR
jgi:leucyl aminopeptidase (aminopeptidase T)